MAKRFITDETNPSYTQRVTSNGQAKVTPFSGTHLKLASAASSSSVVASTSPVWLDKIIVGTLPATASCIHLYDTATSAASAAAASGANHILRLSIPANTVTASSLPGVIPIGVYCTTGLAYALGQDGTSGNANDITLIYQA